MRGSPRQPNAKVRAANAGLTIPAGSHPPTFHGTVRCREDLLDLPLRTRRPTLWSVWCDLFHESVPFEFIDHALAVMALCPQHVFVVCTKRDERMSEYLMRDHADAATGREGLRDSMNRAGMQLAGHPIFPSQRYGMVAGPGWPLPNLIPMVTAENQKQLEARAPWLMKTPAACRAVAIEPALGGVKLSRWLHVPCGCCPKTKQCTWAAGFCASRPVGLSWVIVGQETGRGARPADIGWFRSVRDQCQAAGVPLWVKASPHGKGLIDEVEWRELPTLGKEPK